MLTVTRILCTLLSCALLVASSPAAAGGAPRQANKEPAGAAPKELAEGRRLLRTGAAGEALVRLEAAQKLYAQAGHRPGLAAAHDLLGELYARQGRDDVALAHFERALVALDAIRDAKGKKRKGDVYNSNLLLGKAGHMLSRRGEAARARTFFERMYARPVDKGALGQLKRKGVLGGIGGVLGGSDDALAELAVSGAAGLFAAKSEYDFYRHAVIYAERELGFGRLDHRAGKYADARTHFDNVLDATDSSLPFLGQLGRTRRYRAVAHTSLGDTALDEGRLAEAVKSYESAAKEAEKARRPDLAWPAERGLGRARWLLAEQEKKPERMQKRRAEALAAYRAAVTSVETLRQGGVRADEARAAFLTTTRAVYDEASDVLAGLALAGSAPGRPLEGEALAYAAESFRFAELGRARSLLELLAEAGARVEGGIAPEDLEARRQNLEQQEEVAQALTGLRLNAGVGEEKDEDIGKLEKEADRLHLEYEGIENRIRTRSPRYKELTGAQPLALEEVSRQLLDERTALLEYSLGAERSYLWAVTSEGVTFHPLPPRAEIDRMVSELREQILPRTLRRPLIARDDEEAYRGLRIAPAQAHGDAAAFARASHQLYKTILAPAAPFVGARRLLVAPEGSLSYVPFEALVTAEGGTDYAALPYLVKTNELVYAPSASVVAALRRQGAAGGRPAAGAPVLVVADPVFDAGDPRVPPGDAAGAGPAALNPGLHSAASDVLSVRLDGASKFVRLAGTREEAEQIRQLAAGAGLKADAWLDLNASETNASTRDLSQYRVLHFATHGLLDTERPQFTGLVLSLVGNRGADGYLRTGEIFNLRLGAPLVMLSACETGLGRERRGEGVIGLTRAFLYAGAPAVGVTLWSVADRSTAVLMTDFYRRLLAADNPAPAAAALRDARLQLIEGRQYSAPYHWAPFVLVGDWR